MPTVETGEFQASTKKLNSECYADIIITHGIYNDWLTRFLQEFFECFSEFDVEDCVDERIEEAVDVSEPDKEWESHRMNVTYGCSREQIVSDADGIDDVDREKRYPTEEEHSCKEIRRELIQRTISII